MGGAIVWKCPKCHTVQGIENLFCGMCRHQRGRPVVALNGEQRTVIERVIERYKVDNILKANTVYRSTSALLVLEVFIVRRNICREVLLWEMPSEEFSVHLATENTVDDYIDARADELHRESNG